jgi:hypothetical protein
MGIELMNLAIAICHLKALNSTGDEDQSDDDIPALSVAATVSSAVGR